MSLSAGAVLHAILTRMLLTGTASRGAPQAAMASGLWQTPGAQRVCCAQRRSAGPCAQVLAIGASAALPQSCNRRLSRCRVRHTCCFIVTPLSCLGGTVAPLWHILIRKYLIHDRNVLTQCLSSMPLTLSDAQVRDVIRAAGLCKAQQSATGPALQGGVVLQDCMCAPAPHAPSALQPARPAGEGAVKVCLFIRHLQPCATRHVKCGPNVTAGG